MLLAIDVGNTQTVIGLYERSGTPGDRVDGLLDHWRIATNAERTSDELRPAHQEFLGLHGFTLRRATSQGVAVSSGVPRVTAALREMTQRYFGFDPVVLEPGMKTGMPILYENPREVGADRIANAVGAAGPLRRPDGGRRLRHRHHLRRHRGDKGEYLGGAIVPGIEISMDALFARAALLRRVELVEPRSVIGRRHHRVASSRASCTATSALVDGMVRALRGRARASARRSPPAAWPASSRPLAQTIEHHEPWLTLHGLRLVYEKNAE